MVKCIRKRFLVTEAVKGLFTDGVHHKQYYLNQIAKTLDIHIEISDDDAGIPG